jgi:hypothetical protein
MAVLSQHVERPGARATRTCRPEGSAWPKSPATPHHRLIEGRSLDYNFSRSHWAAHVREFSCPGDFATRQPAASTSTSLRKDRRMTAAPASTSRTPRRIALVLYAVLMVAVFLGLRQARDWSASTYGVDAARSDWQEFRDDVARDAPQAPVQRRVPRSAEPPALVLMRDYFTECLVISLVLTSALYGTIAFFVLGVLSGPPTLADESTDRSARTS